MIPEALSPSPGVPFVEPKVQVEDSLWTSSELSGCVLRACLGRRQRSPGTAEWEYEVDLQTATPEAWKPTLWVEMLDERYSRLSAFLHLSVESHAPALLSAPY